MWDPSQFQMPSRATAGPHMRVSPQTPDHWPVSRAADVSRRLRGLPRVNWLLVGVDRLVWQQLEPRILNLREPITTWSPGARLVLPLTQTGTVILNDVEALPRDDQSRLLDWLESGRQVQVISTTVAHLHPRVHAGQFDETLYYRLNIIYVDASDKAELNL